MRLMGVATIVVLAVTVAGCQTEQQKVQGKEDMLAAAGFTLLAANTADRQTELKTLPPHKFVHQERNGKLLYLYSDPTICGCLYVGSQQAYRQYRSMVFDKQLANEQQMTAQMDWGSWRWEPWGPGYY